jgi:xylulokinase
MGALARAVLEGTAFAMREVLDVMEDRGEPASKICAPRASLAFAVWNQIKADITGKRVMGRRLLRA